MKRGILSVLALLLAITPAVVSVNAETSSNKTNAKEVTLTCEETKKAMDDAKKELDAVKAQVATKATLEQQKKDAQTSYQEALNTQKEAATNQIKLEEAKAESYENYQKALDAQKAWLEKLPGYEKAYNEAKAAYDAAEAEYAKIKGERDSLIEPTKSWKVKYETVKPQYDDVVGRISAIYDIELPAAKAELEEAKAAGDAEKIKAAEAKVDSLRKEGQEKQDTKTSLSGKMMEAESNYKDYSKRLHDAEVKLNDANNKAVATKLVYNKAKEQFDSAKTEADRLNAEVNTQFGVMQSVEIDLANCIDTLKKMQVEIPALYEKMQNAEIAYSKILDVEKTLPAFEKAYNDAKKAHDNNKACEAVKPVEPEKPVNPEKPANPVKPTETQKPSASKPEAVVKPTTGWDNGGPFTTNAEGDIFDRWGNLIYDAPSNVHSSNGYTMVNTSDR